MEETILIVSFLLFLILSNVINRIFPKLPLPFIQLVFGILSGLVFHKSQVHIDPELFLAFVIAPLNFREGQESDIGSFVKYRTIILYLILPTVFLTAIVVGYVAGHLLPVSLPLAACFALGAALGPTDAVAFISIAKRFQFPKRAENILKLEGLLNDASGLVSFQFALTALVTGYFSLAKASLKLALAIMGGFLIGLLFAFLMRLRLTVLEKFDAADVTGALLLELTLPFVAYFVADLLGFSAIIAVVVAGVMQANRLKKVTLFDAQVDRVTSVIWETLNFILNGLVFLIFGRELIRIIGPLLTSNAYSNFDLISIVVLVTCTLFLVRFLAVSRFYAWRSFKYHKSFKKYWREIQLLTFSGVKGSVSIATILLLPKHSVIGELGYSLILFTVGAVTLMSFLTGLLVLPKLAPPLQVKDDYLIRLSILTKVLSVLEEDGKSSENQASFYAVIDNYNSRIRHLILEQESSDIKKDLAELQLMMLSIESDGLEAAYRYGNISIKEYRIYQRYLKYLERQVNRSFVSNITYSLTILMRVIRGIVHEFLTFGQGIRNRKKHFKNRKRLLAEVNRQHLTDLYLSNNDLILETLEDMEGYYNATLIDFLKNERIRDAELIKSGLFVERVIARITPDILNETLRGYYLERRTISEFERDGLISSKESQILRDNVNELESYSLRDSQSSIPYQLLDLKK